MDLRVKQSKIILKNYLFFASKYICCCFTLDAKNIFENEFYSRMYVKKIEKWRIIDENNAFSTIVSREKGIYRYNDVIWRKYRNYTISFLTTRQFKRRIESPTILSSIQSIYIFQISSIDLLFIVLHVFIVSVNSTDFQEIRENQLSDSSLIRTASPTKYKGIQSYSSWRKVSINEETSK